MGTGDGSEQSGSVGASRKLGLADGGELLLLGAPSGWVPSDLPPTVESRVLQRPPNHDEVLGPKSVIVAFFWTAADYRQQLPALARAIFPSASLWAAWPRRAGGHQSDLTDGVVREPALLLGLVDNKVAALDADWSALRLVWRKELRHAPAPPRR
ncbi:MAG: hypothetical protein JWM85_2626 [Acidimicrobiaceae bacterium]|nr:hypothetical protein [Acidimicrobiaceae bacterium]